MVYPYTMVDGNYIPVENTNYKNGIVSNVFGELRMEVPAGKTVYFGLY